MTDHCDLSDIGDDTSTLDDMNSLTQLTGGHVNIFTSNSSGTSDPSQLLHTHGHHLHHFHHQQAQQQQQQEEEHVSHHHHHHHVHHSLGHHFHHTPLDVIQTKASSQMAASNNVQDEETSINSNASSLTNHSTTLLWANTLPDSAGDILTVQQNCSTIQHTMDDIIDDRGKLMLSSMLSMNQLSGGGGGGAYTTGTGGTGTTTATESLAGSTIASNACSTPPSHMMDMHHLCEMTHLAHHSPYMHQSCPNNDDDVESSTGGSSSIQSNGPKVTLV